MGELRELAECVEAARADEQREMLEAAFRAIHGEKPPRVHGGSQELSDWLNLHNQFVRMLDAEAYESAAMTLVPEGSQFFLEEGYCDTLSRDTKIVCRAAFFKPRVMDSPAHIGSAKAATPALALCAAELRAREEVGCAPHRERNDL